MLIDVYDVALFYYATDLNTTNVAPFQGGAGKIQGPMQILKRGLSYYASERITTKL
jgi:hypothetical protein